LCQIAQEVKTRTSVVLQLVQGLGSCYMMFETQGASKSIPNVRSWSLTGQSQKASQKASTYCRKSWTAWRKMRRSFS
jgi:hypothetical protein